jgi:uncharacterized protein (DUF2147 family)
MKKQILTILILLVTAACNLFSQKADDIIGYWLNIDSETKKADSQIQIFKNDDGKYYGKIVWLDEPLENGKPKLDTENPIDQLKTKPILGLQLLNNFVFTGKIWENGTIYDPESGNTYKCKLWFENQKTEVLHLKGFIGISLIGREAIWIREYKKRHL